jgi:RND family efflux transporter MFP subunit
MSKLESVKQVAAQPLHLRKQRRSALFALLFLGIVGASGWWLKTRHNGKPSAESHRAEPRATPLVKVVHPAKGGIERNMTQAGSVHSYETVDLYAMTSGFLRTQGVDIGSRVKKGQVLAEIDVPRERSAVAENAALLGQAKSRTDQMKAKVKVAEATRDAMAATVAQTESDIDRVVAQRRLAESQFLRVKDLNERHAVDRKLVDEQQRDFEAAVAAEKTARLAVETAKAKLMAATAEIDQARSDVAESEIAVHVASARLGKAQVDLDYAKIVAPFDGVVTRRHFHPGSFIRAATDGATVPVLTVSRTDLMRVVVQVPDRYVVFANQGDAAQIQIDGLPGQIFEEAVARVAEAEDHTTRTMRVEIDLSNQDGRLREGMYGTVTIGLDRPSERLTVPVSCVVERSGERGGLIRVVRDGKIQNVEVELGKDDGSMVEVASGLRVDDQVVVRTSRPIDEGSRVSVQAAS